MLKNNSGRISFVMKNKKEFLISGGWGVLGVYQIAVLPKTKCMQSLRQLYLNHHGNGAYVVHNISKHLVNKTKRMTEILALVLFLSFYKYLTIAASRVSIVLP